LEVAACFELSSKQLYNSEANEKNRTLVQVSALTVFAYVAGVYGYTRTKMGETCNRDHSTMTSRIQDWPNRYIYFMEHRNYFDKVLDRFGLPKPTEEA
jgi:hypothetical protein